MKFAISLGALNPSIWSDACQAADELGFESAWIPEHLVFPVTMSGSPHHGASHPPVPPRTPIFDAFVYMGFLAARTTRLRFGTHVYNIGLRHPFITARAAATLDLLSGGRLEFGIGSSWLAEEWDAVGLDFAARGARVDECIDICRQLWTEDEIEHHGKNFDFDPVAFEPKPAQVGGPPIHVGGDAPAALRRAALRGDGWIPMNHALEDLPAALERIAEMRAAAGVAGSVEVTMGGTPTPEEIAAYERAGVDRLIATPWQRTSGAIAGMTRYAAEVIGTA